MTDEQIAAEMRVLIEQLLDYAASLRGAGYNVFLEDAARLASFVEVKAPLKLKVSRKIEL